MDFANAMKEEGKFIRTENGAVALNTTSDARLDLFGTIGALRDADENRITTLFSEAYKKQCTYNPEMKIGKLRNKGNGTQKGNCYGDFKRLHVRNNQYYPTDILDFAGVPAIQQFHPTQKPVELLEYLIKTYTNEGDIVLDNCMGVGSTGIACTNISRRFIGIELDEEYFSIAKKRIYGEIKC